jgi:hypothetical protein
LRRPAAVKGGWQIFATVSTAAIGFVGFLPTRWQIFATEVIVGGLVADPQRLGDGAVGRFGLKLLNPLGAQPMLSRETPSTGGAFSAPPVEGVFAGLPPFAFSPCR